MKRPSPILLTAALSLALAGLGLFGLGEFWRLGAIHQHPGWLYGGLAVVRDTVVSLNARHVELPEGLKPTIDPQTAALYQTNCGACHGGPGIAPASFALGMMPVPPPMTSVGRERPAEEIFWFIRNGLKMSGMPAWEGRLTQQEMLRLTSFVTALPSLSPVQYQALLAEAPAEAKAEAEPVATDMPAGAVSKGDARHGRRLMRLYACRSCHRIPGLVGSDVRVGPDLAEAGSRRYIAGVLANTPQNMVLWITGPTDIDPLTAMPDLGVTPEQAADMAAYLYELSPPPRMEREREAGQ